MITATASVNWIPTTIGPGQYVTRNVEIDALPGWPIVAEFDGSDDPNIQVYARSKVEGSGNARVFMRNNHPTASVSVGAGTVYLVAFDPRPAAEGLSLDPSSEG